MATFGNLADGGYFVVGGLYLSYGTGECRSRHYNPPYLRPAYRKAGRAAVAVGRLAGVSLGAVDAGTEVTPVRLTSAGYAEATH
jgi:hypothetical protein